MNIQLHKPSYFLKEYIKYYWILENYTSSHTEFIYPTGETQILFHFGKPFYRINDNGNINKQPRAAIFGQITKSNNILSYKNSGVVGVVFYPYSLSAFIPVHAKETTNDQIDFSEIYHGWTNYENQFIDTKDTYAKIKVIETFLLSKKSVKNILHYNTAKIIAEYIAEEKGNLSVKQLCAKFNINERYIERIFSQYIGISPKKYTEIMQLNNAIKLFSFNLKANLTDISFNAGYFDQAHFINSFKKFIGLTPSAFRKKFIC